MLFERQDLSMVGPWSKKQVESKRSPSDIRIQFGSLSLSLSLSLSPFYPFTFSPFFGSCPTFSSKKDHGNKTMASWKRCLVTCIPVKCKKSRIRMNACFDLETDFLIGWLIDATFFSCQRSFVTTFCYFTRSKVRLFVYMYSSSADRTRICL